MPEPDQNSPLDRLRKAAELEPESPVAHFALGKALQERNRLTEAVAYYQRAIALDPDFAEAHCNLGLAFLHLGRPHEALASCERSLSIRPELAGAHNSLGLVLQNLGRLNEAETRYRRATELAPEYAEAMSNLGTIAGIREQYAEAAAWFRKAMELRPAVSVLRYNLGCALIGLGQIENAIAELRAAVKLAPDYWEAWSKLGIACHLRGQLGEALAHCSRAVQIAPGAAEASHQLGVVLRESGRLPEAVACFENVLTLKSGFSEARFDLAIAYQMQGKLDASVDAYRRAVDASPGFAGTHCGLGIALGELGFADEAIASIAKAIELKPDYQAAQSALLFHLNYSSHHSPLTIFELHRHWADKHARSLAPSAATYPNDQTPQRRLRIGYVSPDFRQHSVAFFLTPVLAHHDHRNFEVFCYSDVRRADEITQQLKGYADCWRNIVGLLDEQVAAQVREDRIDILVDLAVHSGNNRLLVFARKPAPVQATWLGYAGTTGLVAVDYKITDPHLDPVGETESWHSEQLVRLPDCYFCYTPPPEFPDVSPLPAAGRGFVSFCAFQNLAKVSPQAIELWSQTMVAVPDSRLILKARGLNSEATRQRLRDAFGACGIGAQRLQFEDWGDMTEYLARFGEVDIALDTVPFNGGTTTFHALWMGVPIVTLAGRSALGRIGASILGNLGLPELVAHTPEEFAAICVRLAQDAGALASLRGELRQRMASSPLTDARRFSANLEALYRKMWETWCRQARK